MAPPPTIITFVRGISVYVLGRTQASRPQQWASGGLEPFPVEILR